MSSQHFLTPTFDSTSGRIDDKFKARRNHIAIFFALGLALSCKKTGLPNGPQKDALDESHLSGAEKPLEGIETENDTIFSLAEYAATSPSLKDGLGSYSSKDRSYLELGTQDRFAVQTNARVQNILSRAVDDKKIGVTGRFWIDGFAFSNKIGGSGAGSLADMGIEANQNELYLKGHLRFLGKDRLAGMLKSAIDQVLTRSLSGDALLFGSELLGFKVGGNVGGQIGLKADLDRNVDEAIVLAFTPKSGLNSGISSKVESLSFSRVEVAGLVNLIDSAMVNQGTFGALRKSQLMLGDIGMDGGEFKALDGQIVVGASVGSQGVLPSGVDKNLWTMMTEKAADFLKTWGVWMPSLAWKHDLWNPKPLYVKDLPEFAKPFMSFFKKPPTIEQCLKRYEEVGQYVRQTSENIDRLAREINQAYETSKDPAQLSRIRVLANVKTNYQLILAEVQEYCFTL